MDVDSTLSLRKRWPCESLGCAYVVVTYNLMLCRNKSFHIPACSNARERLSLVQMQT